MINLDLTGKRAVVTGASLGIGEACVKMLADHGAEVCFCARTPESVEKLSSHANEKGSIKGYIADMGQKNSTQDFIEKILHELTSDCAGLIMTMSCEDILYSAIQRETD